MSFQILSRRRLLLGAIASGVAVCIRKTRAAAPQPATAVAFRVPRCACDSHTHVFGDPARFPFSATRSYTPPLAPPSELIKLQEALGIQRVVIVTASAYGNDNSATLDGVQKRSPHARAVVVVDDCVSVHELDAMDRKGACGVRLFLAGEAAEPGNARRQFETALRQVEGRAWHIQIFTDPPIIPALHDLVRDSPVPVVFDHFGGARGEWGLTQTGFGSLLDLVRSGKAYVKLSAAYRLSRRAPDFEDMAPLAHALIEANGDRILWASDWPHTNGLLPGKKATDVFPFIRVDDAHLLNLFGEWVPEPQVRKHILVDNPSRLYGFKDD